MSKSCYERLISSRFFFTPRNRKEFFLDLLNRQAPSKAIVRGSDAEIDNTFSVFGSDPVKLSLPFPWHEDVKTGGTWELGYYTRVRLHEREKHSDIKVPWEMSRFHFALWLGCAYWITGNEAYATKFADMVEDWIRANPFPYGVNWMTSMEVAFRAINWTLGCAYFVNSKSFSQSLQESLLLYLYLHGAFIEFNLEFALRNHNHLLSDATGLFVLGLFFR
ncbi:MAG: heparinase II/III family protein, partial [Bacteroidota bacterium]